jgi:phosphoglycolate phosphatase-like HAD superfamily hydrolase
VSLPSGRLARVLVLFDIDGTLIGGDGAGRRSFERACHEVLGVPGALDGYSLDGMTDPLILDYVFETFLRRTATADEARTVMDAYVRHLERELVTARFIVMPAVEETLARLEARGAVVGLATGNLEGGARLKLERGGLWSRFPFGGFGSDAPDRAELTRVAIRRGLARVGRPLEPREILVVGDTPRDVAAAHAAGATCVAVATGRHTVEELLAAGADAAYPTLREWLPAL